MKRNIEISRFTNKKADADELKIVRKLSNKLFGYLNKEETFKKLKSLHTKGNSSQKIQDVIIYRLKDIF